MSNIRPVKSDNASAPEALLAALPLQYDRTTFSRLPAVRRRFGWSHAKIYSDISKGIFPPGAALGANLVGWPETELNVLAAAFVRGFSKGELQQLVGIILKERTRAGTTGNGI